jgi:hypothetical protein
MDISELISSIHAAADSPGNVNEEERSNPLAACDKLKARLESPREAALRPSLQYFHPFDRHPYQYLLLH